MKRRALSVMVWAIVVLACAANVEAQDRSVGRRGATQVSLDGSVTARQTTTLVPVLDNRGRVIGTETSQEWQGDYQIFIENGRFLTDNFVLAVGALFGGGIGGDANMMSGLNASVRIYMTPASKASPYVTGGGGFVTLRSDQFTATGATETVSSTFGQVFGAAGFDMSIRENATMFFEGRFERDMAEGGGTNGLRFKVGLRVLL